LAKANFEHNSDNRAERKAFVSVSKKHRDNAARAPAKPNHLISKENYYGG